MEENLEYKMYFFVNYQLTGIQKSLQAGHSALEYADKFGNTEEYTHFIREWKTWIILDAGTTNNRRDLDGIALGTLNQIGDALAENDIPFSFFEEPDLNDALTALCFIADERVFDKEKYPNFVDYILNIKLSKDEMTAQNIVTIKMKTIDELIIVFPDFYKEWVRFVGGVKNVFLRDLLKDKKLAR